MIEAIKNRRSIRKYLPGEIDDDVILEILRDAMRAPSGDNTQPWRFIIVRSKETRAAISRASHGQRWMEQAPVHIVCIADIRSRLAADIPFRADEASPEFELKQVIRDTSIATSFLLLEAAARGIGSCWVAWYAQKDIRPLLGIPEDKFVVGVITLGYPAENPAPRPRKEPRSLISYERWENADE